MSEVTKNKTEQFLEKALDLKVWKKLYYKNQKSYARKRLLAIKHLHDGMSRLQVCKLMSCSYNTLSSWIDKFIAEGVEGLVEPITHKVPQRLSLEQKEELKKIVLTQRPQDYGIDRNIWTGELIAQVIHQKWNKSFKTSRIYEILAEAGLSYQKAHRDYANANKAEQREFVGVLKKG
jgi:transposase